MTSHREAPSISKDPVADNTDLYAFVSPDKPDTVTMISNFIPLEEPAGGPNFHAFGDDVLYAINIDNDADAMTDISYQFRFTTTIQSPNTFLYNTGPIMSLTDANWNVRQLYSVTRVDLDKNGKGKSKVLGTNLSTPPVNIGPRSTPDYKMNLADPAIHDLGSGVSVFAGQRGEGFYVDLGSIFDLGTLRPFQSLHLIPGPFGPSVGVDGTKGFNVHSIAIQVPKTQLTSDGSSPTDPMDSKSVIGIYTSASRQRASVLPTVNKDGHVERGHEEGPFTQVSRLGMPLINEVVIPLGMKDFWNLSDPSNDSQFVQSYQTPQLQTLLPILYPGQFPNLAGVSSPRADLVAILLTGIPPTVVPGFPGNFTGSTQADLLRLNMAIPPNTTVDPNDSASAFRFGLLGGDNAGFPNGRRVFDNVTAVELRAIAGATLPFVMPLFTPDAAAVLLTDGTTNDLPYLPTFPYLATPYQGYSHEHDPEDE